MKKKIFMVLGVVLVLLAFLTLYALLAGMGARTDAIDEAAAAGTGVTDLYMDMIREIVTIIAELLFAACAFFLAFEDGGTGYVPAESDETEEEEAEREQPEEQVARVEAERAEREAQAKKPRAFSERFKKKEKAEESAPKDEPPAEPCLQCKTCANRTADEDKCKVYDHKPGYIRNNRFACNDYREATRK